jgi:hypothetical protein
MAFLLAWSLYSGLADRLSTVELELVYSESGSEVVEGERASPLLLTVRVIEVQDIRVTPLKGVVVTVYLLKVDEETGELVVDRPLIAAPTGVDGSIHFALSEGRYEVRAQAFGIPVKSRVHLYPPYAGFVGITYYTARVKGVLTVFTDRTGFDGVLEPSDRIDIWYHRGDLLPPASVELVWGPRSEQNLRLILYEEVGDMAHVAISPTRYLNVRDLELLDRVQLVIHWALVETYLTNALRVPL